MAAQKKLELWIARRRTEGIEFPVPARSVAAVLRREGWKTEPMVPISEVQEVLDAHEAFRHSHDRSDAARLDEAIEGVKTRSLGSIYGTG
ncbi:MAG TPA: hypothetical protein VEQ41_01705 [Solirubrobacterales bacterium]|nr:hypothetical protein [Solirubrobacterales bacterium]